MRLHPVKEARWFLWENTLTFNFSCRINIFFTTSQSVGTIGFAQGKKQVANQVMAFEKKSSANVKI